MEFFELKSFLDQKAIQYESPNFIESDPIAIPHQFSKLQDIEIAAFLTATIAWGRRQMILKNAKKMMKLMDNSPYDFIKNHQESDLEIFTAFKHRTFQPVDIQLFIQSLQHIYTNYNSLEALFTPQKSEQRMDQAIDRFRTEFFKISHEKRTLKHLSSPAKKSAAKRIHMFLRWMVRSSNKGVDFGIWKEIPTAKLSCPLDVHTGNVGRKLGIINRKQNDLKTLQELDSHLRLFCKNDPVKYDFALFGLGVFEGF